MLFLCPRTLSKEVDSVPVKTIKCKQKERKGLHCVLRCFEIQISQRRQAMLRRFFVSVKASKSCRRLAFILNVAYVAACVVFSGLFTPRTPFDSSLEDYFYLGLKLHYSYLLTLQNPKN